jgi:hypothetical protein
MTEVYKMMKDDGNGGEAQFYPQTHADAVIDIEKSQATVQKVKTVKMEQMGCPLMRLPKRTAIPELSKNGWPV